MDSPCDECIHCSCYNCDTPRACCICGKDEPAATLEQAEEAEKVPPEEIVIDVTPDRCQDSDDGEHCECYYASVVSDRGTACCYCGKEKPVVETHDVMADLESAFGVVKEDHERLMDQANARRQIIAAVREVRALLAVAGLGMPYMNELQREAYLWGVITLLVSVVEEMFKQMESPLESIDA